VSRLQPAEIGARSARCREPPPQSKHVQRRPDGRWQNAQARAQSSGKPGLAVRHARAQARPQGWSFEVELPCCSAAATATGRQSDLRDSGHNTVVRLYEHRRPCPPARRPGPRLRPALPRIFQFLPTPRPEAQGVGLGPAQHALVSRTVSRAHDMGARGTGGDCLLLAGNGSVTGYRSVWWSMVVRWRCAEGVQKERDARAWRGSLPGGC
jgi:hypothetical protein